MIRGLLTLLLLTGLAGPAVGEEDTVYTVSADDVRVRSGPGTKHPVLGKLDREFPVVVVGSKGRWKKVRVPGGFACFVHGKLIEKSEDGTAEVTADDVLLRATASQEHGALSTRLKRGEVLTVLGTAGEWVKVIPPERTTAWIFDGLLKELGPADEYRAALAVAAANRRKALLGDRQERRERQRAAKKREERRRAVLEVGAEVLDGKGDAGDQEARLKKIALESDDDLTRGYATALLSLVALRKDVLRLEARLAMAKEKHAEAAERAGKELETARKRYEDALDQARKMKTRREETWRAVGTIEKRKEGWVLVSKKRVLYRLSSERFRLEDYAGQRVGVNGRMVVTEGDGGRSHLQVEKMEILPGRPPERSGR
jgi:SH3-like domain-containing protein